MPTQSNRIPGSRQPLIQTDGRTPDPIWFRFWEALSNQVGQGGSVWTVGSGPPNNDVGNNGDFYLDSDNGDVYEKIDDVYTVVANIDGPAGAQGATGAQGSQGDIGPTGAQGATGAQGVDGANGMVPTLIPVGDSFTVPVNRQATYAVTIDVQGTLILDGDLILVD